MHNLDQFIAIKAAFETLKKTKNHPGLFTEATIPGIGQYAGYWDNDVPFETDSLRYIVS